MPRRMGCIHSQIPPEATQWRKETLSLLNARFDSQSVTDFTFSGLAIPDELQQRMADSIRPLSIVIDRSAEAIANLNNSDPITDDFDFDNHKELTVLMSRFLLFYRDLPVILLRDSPTTSHTHTPQGDITDPPDPQNSPLPEKWDFFSNYPTDDSGQHFCGPLSPPSKRNLRNMSSILMASEFINNSRLPPLGRWLIIIRPLKMKIYLGRTSIDVENDGRYSIHSIWDCKYSYSVISLDVTPSH